MYQHAVTRLTSSADQIAQYRNDLAVFADTLAGRSWGIEVTGPIADMTSQLNTLEGIYRDLAGQVQHQGDQGAAAYEQAPWVPGNLLADEIGATLALECDVPARRKYQGLREGWQQRPETDAAPAFTPTRFEAPPEVLVSEAKSSGLPCGELRVVKPLTPGKRAAVDLVQDADGRVAIRKIFHPDPDDMNRADREVAAAAVANAVGITDLEVRHVDPDTVLMTYFEGKTGTELAHATMSPEDVALLDDDAATAEQIEDPEWLARWSKADDEYNANLQPWMRAPGAKEIGLFDYLALNIDRNSSNWIVDDDGVVHPIDHDASFIGAIQQVQYRLVSFDSPFVRAWLAKDSARSGHNRPDALASPFSRSHLEQVMERLEDAKPALDKIPPVCGVSTYDLVRQRLAWLIEACDATP